MRSLCDFPPRREIRRRVVGFPGSQAQLEWQRGRLGMDCRRRWELAWDREHRLKGSTC
jgi:hypothetical protein